MKATQAVSALAGFVLIAIGGLLANSFAVGVFLGKLHVAALALGAIGGALGLGGAGLLYAAFRSAPPSRWKPAAAGAAALVFLAPSIFIVFALTVGRLREGKGAAAAAGRAPAPSATGASRPAASRGLLQALLLCERANAGSVPEPVIAMLPGERAELEALWPRIDPVERRNTALLAGTHHLLTSGEEERVLGVMREWRAGKTAWLARLDEAVSRVPPETSSWALEAARRPAPAAEALAGLDPAEREEASRVWRKLGRAHRAELLLILGTPQKKGAARRMTDQTTPNELQMGKILTSMGEKLLKEYGLEGRTLGDAALAAYDRGDFEGAMGFWLILAYLGDAEAQYSVGSLYAGGKGVPASAAAAYRWYALAARAGDAQAAKRAASTWSQLSESERAAVEDEVGAPVVATIN